MRALSLLRRPRLLGHPLQRRRPGDGAGIATSGAVIDGLRRKSITDSIDRKLSDACAALGLTIEGLLSVSLTAMRSVPFDAG